LNKAVLGAVLAVTVAVGCETTRVGQSTTVQFGVVSVAEPVTLDSNAAKGAVVGGTLGLLVGGGDSNFGNAIRGATVGGAATALAEGGNRSGMSYTVNLTDGSAARVVTDQRHIHVGDCVAVERVGSTANIRRVSSGYCDPANARAVGEVAPEVRSEALACQSAKQELVEAKSEEAVNLASRKIELLCNS